MNDDLKLIKKKYGEEMMHLCRELFPTLLEQEGLLPKLLFSSFKETRSLAPDLIREGMEDEFKSYIYNLVDDVENHYQEKTGRTPEELLKEAGYQLFECHNEEEIQSFKKYYASSEELCTFRGKRLNRCHVFFSVKENVDEIKRENFSHPNRQDEYGTSVISIQFTRDPSHTLSIKNRYNHTVNNPDSTFSNNLDNIIPGLTESFEEYYGMTQTYKQGGFELDGYVKANDGKYYKFNYELGNVYYCEDNVIIDNFEVKEYPKEKYLIFDYFILDLKNKKVSLYDESISDCFPETFGNIEKVAIKKEKEEKIVSITVDGKEDIEMVLDRCNNLVSFKNGYVREIGNNFLNYNRSLTALNLPNTVKIGHNFLDCNEELSTLNLPNLVEIGIRFLTYNQKLTTLYLPNLTSSTPSFLPVNEGLRELYLPKVTRIANGFLQSNKSLVTLYLPSLMSVGNFFLDSNENLEALYLPSLMSVGNGFLKSNKRLTTVELPNLTSAGNDFLESNESLSTLNLPALREAEDGFCKHCHVIENVNIPFMPELEQRFSSKKTL